MLTLQTKVMWHFGTITCNILVKLHVTFVKISVTFFVTFCDICPHIAAYRNQVKNMTWKLYSDKKTVSIQKSSQNLTSNLYTSYIEVRWENSKKKIWLEICMVTRMSIVEVVCSKMVTFML